MVRAVPGRLHHCRAGVLQQEQTGIQTAISNASMAGNVIGTAEGGLNEVSSLLTQLQGLVGTSRQQRRFMSSSETAADQLQVDSILLQRSPTPSRPSTTFEGNQLLQPEPAHTTSSVGLGGYQPAGQQLRLSPMAARSRLRCRWFPRPRRPP